MLKHSSDPRVRPHSGQSSGTVESAVGTLTLRLRSAEMKAAERRDSAVKNKSMSKPKVNSNEQLKLQTFKSTSRPWRK